MKKNSWRIACVGAGLIGQGWTTLFSSKGYQVILQDVSKTVLEGSLRAINKNLMFLEAKTILKPGESAAAMKRIKTTRDISESADSADYVQESVFDDLQLKSRVFKEIFLISSAFGDALTGSPGRVSPFSRGLPR
ncbi:MAG: 3-hydroxyacyl-CoA dehydrogenase NAD-binding domain-containing protein [Desulfobacterales bacterium]|jgi:3-hydroxyacyl-CoA dehydrogenase|nr:hypothetical protein [Desulfobacter sp.]MDP6394918.1 3-hydroxyacyl-CoA dehydrogenase NAD-binding domain-containing protein [Desulfobacterales bacterium]MDP6682425.1 3-hydroxyacyl-CoA dehydrogenase NAD-binding domain-containing protein [Desulfobacterales bacterium]MDP6807175.1 3-hydroxyacyl-CoA dehydrogenase NAD-binding domain-containing protein [Desulfobacterales bacterium]|tara:strand:+ start:19273 stop:19677 length:405 start_codon:yes stop_codon:yes gene_type:complete